MSIPTLDISHDFHDMRMACGLALKRPHEYDSYLVEEGYATEAKRARHTTHCSPFRPQMGTIAASLPSTSSFAQHVAKRENSAFSDVTGCQLTSEQIGAYLRTEIRNLKRRKLIPKRTLADNSESGDENAPASKYRTPNSPTQSGSDSEGECATVKKSPHTFTKLNEKPQFSLKQVQLICERLLKEQEIRLRHEYETALNQRLDEQHQQYVQFVEEQIASQHREKKTEDLSYLS